MAAQVEEEALSYLECQVCFEKFDERSRIPRLLLCGHTFCQVCIDSLEMEMIVQCPNKDGETKLGSKRALGLKKNYALCKIIEGMAMFPESEKIGTMKCENDCVETATKRCEDCEANLCDSCCTTIHRLGLFRKHRVSGNPLHPQEVSKNVCDAHNKDLDLYCCKDKACICTICAFTTHKGHDISSISGVAVEMKEKLQKLSHKLRSEEQRLFGIARELSKESKKIQSNCVLASKQITDIFQAVRDKVDAAERGALKTLRDVTKIKDDVIQKTREDVSLRISELSVAVETSKQKALYQDDISFLDSSNDVLAQMERIDSQQRFSASTEVDTSMPITLNRDFLDSLSSGIRSLVHIDRAVLAPPVIKHSKTDRNSATVSWKKPKEKDNVMELQLRYSEEEKELNWVTISIDKVRSSTVLDDLKYGTSYVAELRSRNSYDWSSHSKRFRFKTELEYVQCTRCNSAFVPSSNGICKETTTELYHPKSWIWRYGGYDDFWHCCDSREHSDPGCKTRQKVINHSKHLQ